MDSSQVLSVAKPVLLDFVSKSKTNFMARFGDWVKSVHYKDLEDIFLQAGLAKVELLCATTPEDVQEWEDVFETNLLRIETLGLEIFLVGKIDARQFLKDEIRTALSYVPVVAGIIVKVALPLILPGVGGIIASPLGAGLEYLLDKAMGVK